MEDYYMQLHIYHEINNTLALPLNYQHILQAIIYHNLESSFGYSDYIHNNGFTQNARTFKLFTFSLLNGQYKVRNKKIIFSNWLKFEVHSPEIFMLKMLAENIQKNGIYYGNQLFQNVQTTLMDSTIENEELHIRMLSPCTVYSTDPNTKKTYYYTPDDEEFSYMVNENFHRKYTACYGVEPDSNIWIEPIYVTGKDKFVTKYKDFYICGYMGEYYLAGKRKYLDFLYQTGLGSKNSQGFGMFVPIY